MNLTDFFKNIKDFPTGVHRFLPGATDENLQILTERIGKLPEFLEKLLKEFDGAELFINGIPFLTIFRSINNPPLTALEWSSEWFIDNYTKKWRESNTERNDDFAIAMTNYGGLILADKKGKIKEWDTSEGRWIFQNMLTTDWFEKIVLEGKEILEV